MLENWLRELRTWCPAMRAAKYYGPQAQRAQLARDLGEQGFDVLVTSYSYFEGDSAAQVADRRFLCSHSWGVVVFDEAHALKDRRSSRFRRLARLQANPNPKPSPSPNTGGWATCAVLSPSKHEYDVTSTSKPCSPRSRS